MIFSLKTTIITKNKVCINNNILERVYSTKFLGVIVNSKLNWNEHIKYIKKKMSKNWHFSAAKNISVCQMLVKPIYCL